MPWALFEAVCFTGKLILLIVLEVIILKNIQCQIPINSLRIKELNFPAIDQTSSVITSSWLFNSDSEVGQNIIMQIILVDSN